MESATIRRAPAASGPDPARPDRAAGRCSPRVAWVITSDQMAGMDAGPGTDPGALGFFIGVWVVMMAAMMFPSIAPMVVMHVRIQEGRRERGQPVAVGATALFVGGYLLAWTAAGLIGYGIFQLGRAVDRGPLLLGQRRPVPRRRHRPRGGRLPAHPAEGRLPAALPKPVHVPDEALAAGAAAAACAWGSIARRLVHRLLLGADGGAVRARRDEPRLDGVHRRA